MDTATDNGQAYSSYIGYLCTCEETPEKISWSYMIISASRRCDIPAFYPQWLVNRFDQRFVLVRNPFNKHQVGKVDLSPDAVEAIVFWSKNPEPLIDYLDRFAAFPFYFQYTITGYPAEYEPNLPPLKSRLATFAKLAERLGPERVVWRYDPIFISPICTLEWHERMFSSLAQRLSGYTDTCIISFLDVYRHVQDACESASLRVPSYDETYALAGRFVSIAAQNHMIVQTCAEATDLSSVGVKKGACIDSRRLEKIAGGGWSARRDPYQRKECCCLESVDIGTYDICSHACVYCYANTGRNGSSEDIAQHDDNSPFLIGDSEPKDIIYDRRTHPMKLSQVHQYTLDFSTSD